MNLDQTINELTQEIAARQDAINALHKLKLMPSANPKPKPAANGDWRPKPKAHQRLNGPGKVVAPRAIPTGPSGQVATAFDKPETVGAAMKALVRQQARFTGEELRNLFLADKHNAKLLEESLPGIVAANLTYWASRGYLERKGETPLESTYTVTAAGKEWFAA